MLTLTGRLEQREAGHHEVRVELAGRRDGAHAEAGILFGVTDGRVDWVSSQRCDHAGGNLVVLADGTIRCPLHGWTLHPDGSCYENIQLAKAPLPFVQDGNVLVVQAPQRVLGVPHRGLDLAGGSVTVRLLAHACVEIEVAGTRIVTDPWLLGPCFTTGWWHAHPPPADAVERVRTADLVYISHNHPDHLHPETLALLDRSTPIVAPRFSSGSTENHLRSMGFTEVLAAELNHLYELDGSGVALAVLKSGDFREDSGLLVVTDGFTGLLTVDSNALNDFVLPTSIDLLMTSFASGASGFPLCFENLSLPERRRIVRRNRRSALRRVVAYAEATRPRCYIPYAGFFTEAAGRDHVIRAENVKNAAKDACAAVERSVGHCVCIDPLEHDTVTIGSEVRVDDGPVRPRMYEVDDAYVGVYLDAARDAAASFDLDVVATYFRESAFRDDLVLFLVPTDDEFGPSDEGLRVDFRTDVPDVARRASGTLRQEFDASGTDGSRRLLIRVRLDSLWAVVVGGLPWEDLSIGFQCRIDRKPDIYNTEFWFHFSNTYLGMVRS